MRRLLTALIAAGCLSLCPATVIYDNLGAAPDETGIHEFMYDSFSTGASGFSLVDVEVKLQLLGGPSGGIMLALYTDAEDPRGPSPGDAVTGESFGWISDSKLSSTLTNYKFVLSTPFVLDPSTRYWIGLTANFDSHAGWSQSRDVSGTGVANEYYLIDFTLYSNSEVDPNLGGPFQMRLSDEAGPGDVPEPASLLAMGGALLALGLLRRKTT